MNKFIIGGIIAGGIALIAGGVVVASKIVKSNVYKQISADTGISLDEVKASFKEFGKEIKNLRTNKATKEQIASATEAFYESLEAKAK
jgi:hypothetical protein